MNTPIEIDHTVLASYMKDLDLNSVDNPSREIVRQIGICAFWGARCWVIEEQNKIISFNMTKFGKRKKNTWEPYANWFLAFTLPERRRQGFAKALGFHVRKLAVEAGCQRIRSLAGSWAGACMHRAMGDQFWGLTENLEIVVDSPILPREWPDTTPGAVRNAVKDGQEFTVPWTLDQIEKHIGAKALRYDK